MAIVQITGVVVAVLGVTGFLAPESFRSLVNLFHSRSMVYLAAALRIAIGTVLLLAAPACRFPLGIRVLGVLAIAVGAVLPFLKQAVVETMVGWMAQMSTGGIRSWALMAVILGVFLIYAGGTP